MNDTKREIPNKGEREIDKEQRFLNHPSGNLLTGLMELVHNLLTYVKTHGWIKIEDCEKGLCNYHFYNDADAKDLPTFERLKEIASKAGKGSSSLKGHSLFGLGTEIAALSCRKRQDSVVTVVIYVVRDGYKYGLTLEYDANASGHVPYEMIEPVKCDEENSYYVVLKGCIEPNNRKNEIGKLKRKIVDTMSNNGVEIEFFNREEKDVLKYEDFLYAKELKGTDNYEEYSFRLKDNGEQLTIRIADVADIAKSNKGSKYELKSKCQPDLSGGALRYNEMATICRSWDFVHEDIKYHQTQDGIRFDIICGNTIFREMHRESPAKTKTSMVLTHFTDKNREPITIISDADGKEYKISHIKDLLYNFIQKHKNDKKNTNSNTSVKNTFSENVIKNVSENSITSVSTQKVPSTFLEAIDNGTITLKKIEETLNYFRNIFEKHEVIKHFKSEYEDILDEMYEEIIEPLMNDKEVLEHARKRERKTDFDLILEAADNIISEKCYTRAK